MESLGAIVLEGHVQGLSNTRSLGELGIPVYVLDQCNCLARYSRYCTKFIRCPQFHSDGFVPFLIELAKKENLHGWFLIASNDHIVEQLSNNYQKLAPFYKMLVPKTSILQQIIDKGKLMEVAQACGTHIPITIDISTIKAGGQLPFPLLIKGRRGLSFSKKTHVKAIQVNNRTELETTLQTLSSLLEPAEFLIQELIISAPEDHVTSFTCFAEDGKILSYWMGQKLREHPIKYGTATCAKSVFEQQVLEEAIPLVSELGYTGICEIEFMKDKKDGLFKLIEINPRTWLWVGLAKYCGIDYAKMAYRYVNHQEQVYPEHYQVGVTWVNRLTDFCFSLKAMFCGQLSFKDYVRSLMGKKVYAIWSWHDVLPGLVFPFMSFYIARKRG